MKRFSLIAALMLLSLVFCSQAFATLVICNGNICGGGGPRNYFYELIVEDSTFAYFDVATADGASTHYDRWMAQYYDVGSSAWQDLPNLSRQLLGNICERAGIGMTPHGQIAGPYFPSTWTIYWGWSAVNATQYRFGFDNPRLPEDMGWTVSGSGWGQQADWTKAVGWGEGPIHGPSTTPVPEPSGILALSGGLLGLLGFARKRRA